MTDKNQHTAADLRDMLFAKLQAASTLDSMRDLLDEIERNTDALGLETFVALARRALVAIARLTAESPEVAVEVITRHLLPLCLITDMGNTTKSRQDCADDQRVRLPMRHRSDG